MWTRKLTWLDRQDDWSVLYKGVSIGRVHLTWAAGGGQAWNWGVHIGRMTGGRSDSLEKGLEAVRNTLLALGPDLEPTFRKYVAHLDQLERMRKGGPTPFVSGV